MFRKVSFWASIWACMKQVSLPIFIFLVLVACRSALAADPMVFDQEAMIGQWRFKSGVKAGAEVATERLQADVQISTDAITLSSSAGKFVIGYTLDSTTSPAKISMTIKESPFGSGVMSKGLIEIQDGDILLAYVPNDQTADHPEKLVSNAENGLYLFRLTRRPQVKHEDLLGRWTIASGKKAGEAVPEGNLAGTIEVDRETVTFSSPAGKFVFAYSLDTSTTPAKIDFTTKESPFGAGSQAKGRLDLADGQIVLGYVPETDVKEYPLTLASTPENKMHVFYLKKAE